jgi:hypothetical protein
VRLDDPGDLIISQSHGVGRGEGQRVLEESSAALGVRDEGLDAASPEDMTTVRPKNSRL